MSISPPEAEDEPAYQRGLAHLPLELLRKIAKELSSRSHLQAFALVCRSTTLPARELLFDTLTVPKRGDTLLSPNYLILGKARLFPFPDLVRRIVLYRESGTLSFSPVDLAFLLHDFPSTRTLEVSGHFTTSMPQHQLNIHQCFSNINCIKMKTSDQDYSHDTLRILLNLCRDVTELDLGTDLLTLESPFKPWHFAPQTIPSSLVLPNLRRLTIRTPLYLALPATDIISLESLKQVRSLEIDFTEESVGRTWYSGIGFPPEFFEFFGSSIERLYFNFPLYSKRSNVDTLAHLLSPLTSLRTLSLGSISSGAAWLLLGSSRTCKEVVIHNEDGSPDWMGLHRFFMEHEGEDALAELKGKRIWMDRSDCKFCDENFQKDTEIKCRKLGIRVVVLNEGKRARSRA